MLGRKSILVKLVLIMLFLSVVSGGIILGIALNEQRGNMGNTLILENKRLAEVAARSIEAGYVEQSWPFRTLKQINDSEDVLFWWIVKPDGLIHLADNPGMRGKKIDIASFEAEEEADVKDYVYGGEDIKFLVQPLCIGEPGKIWYLCMGISLKSVKAAANGMILTSISYFSLIIAFACALSFLLARRFTKPIMHLVEGTKAISRGDFDAKVKIKTGDEIEGLGDAFNKMAEQVKSSIGALRQKSEEQKVLLSTIPAFVYFKDRNGNYIAANKAFADMTGTSVDEIAGKTDYDFFPKGEADFYRKCDQEVMGSGEPKYNIEEPVTGADGKKMWVSTSKTPFFDSDGKVIGMVGITLDITERKRAGEALQEAEARFRTIVETAPSLLIITDAEGNNIYVSPNCEEITGYTQEELRGEQIWWVHEDDTPRAKELFEHTFREGVGGKNFEYKIVKKSGEVRHASSSWVPLKDEKGKLKGIVFQTIDITERKRAEEALQKAHDELELRVKERTAELVKANEQLKQEIVEREQAEERLRRVERLATIGEFSSGVAHELRQPLGVISNSAYFLGMKLKDIADEKVNRHLAILDKEVKRANRLITDLLEFARMPVPTLNECDINQVVEEALSSVDIPPNVEVKKELKGDFPKIHADFNQIQRTCLNIIANAILAMPGSGSLKIKTEEDKEEGNIEISIADTGEGIPEENMEKIFEPLFTTKPRGVGLGLSLCKKYVEAHGGKIEVESEVGKGSTFTVKLPVSG